MCYYTDQKGTAKELKNRFLLDVDDPKNLLQSDFINGFAHPNIPIITNTQPDIITTNFSWGLIPNFAEDASFRKNTLNARIETIDQKKSFKNSVINRCLIIATGYFEWRWLDEKGNRKEKFYIFSSNDEIFTFAGIYNIWTDKMKGYEMRTFSVLTTQANEKMKYVHNRKKRMPIMLQSSDERSYLQSEIGIEEFAFPNYDPGLVVFPISQISSELTLF